jgi:tetratricopeptide (TPR) repeat protein/transcriptional regulator with XRE-family HTH domain
MRTIQRIPNHFLRKERELRGWSQQYEAEQISAPSSCYISRWERGVASPSPFYREKLCALFRKDAHELGFFPDQQDLDPSTLIEEEPAIEEAPQLLQPALETNTHPGSVSSQVVSSSNDQRVDSLLPFNMRASHIVGHTSLICELIELLCSDTADRCVALHGLPGVGKTSLALVLAQDEKIRQTFYDGVLWSALGPSPNVPTLLTKWARLLHMSDGEMKALSSNEAWATAIQERIGQRRFLLIIDDVWHLEDALSFKVGGPNCTYLITTRFPDIALLFANDNATTIHELNEGESLTLLARFIPTIVEQEVEATRALVQFVGGLPLALMLLGRYLRLQMHSGQPRRIQTALRRLQHAEERIQLAEPRAALERSANLFTSPTVSLQAIIETSDRQLSEEVQNIFHRLSILPAKPLSFSEEAVLAIAGTEEEILDQLTDAGLLEGCGPGRYMLHQTISDYTKMWKPDAASQDRLIAYVVHYVDACKQDYDRLEKELPVILNGLDMAFEKKRYTQLIQLLSALAPIASTRGFYPLLEKHLQRAYEAALLLDYIEHAIVFLLHMGHCRSMQGEYARAEALYRQGLQLARQNNDHEHIVLLLSFLGSVSMAQGNYDQAEMYALESLKIARQEGQHIQVIHLLSNLGALSVKKGRYLQAENYLQEGLEMARSLHSNKGLVGLYTNAGWLAGERGNYIQAEKHLQEGLKVARQIDHRSGSCHILINLGWVLIHLGDYARAEMYLQEGLTMAQTLAMNEAICEVLYMLGRLKTMQKHYTQAENYLQEGLALARQTDHHERISQTLTVLGYLETMRDNYSLATEYLQEGLVLARKIDGCERICYTLLCLGMLSIKQQELQQAEVYLQESLTLALQVDKPYNIGTVLYMLGVCHLQQMKIDSAERYFKKMQTYTFRSCPEMNARATYGQALINAARGNIATARSQGQVSLDILEKIGHAEAEEIRNWLRTLRHQSHKAC